jgi:PPOX class probable F420-dependent enzyme
MNMAPLSEFAKNMLNGKNFATVSTTMPDGSPQASIVWIDTDGENVIFNTADGRVKTNNMRRDPRVSVTVFNMQNPYQQVTIRGRVTEFTHEGADAHIDKLSKKYLDRDRYPGHTDSETRVIVKIQPDHVGSMGG